LRQMAASCTLLRSVSDTLGDSGRSWRKAHVAPRTLPYNYESLTHGTTML